MTNYITKTIKNGVEANIPVTSVNGQYGDVVVAGKEYNAGEGIEFGTIQDYSAMQGPAPDGFHVPLTTEWQAVYDVWTALDGGSSDGTNFGIALKLPFAGSRYYSTAGVNAQGSFGYYWSSSRYSTDNAYRLNFNSTALKPQNTNFRANGFSVRCFKNSPVVPTSSWTKLYGTSIEAGGIFWNATDGLISLSGDGTTWITIADKNLGATTVWNSGDTLSEANCGKYYQRGNNYGFPRTGTIANQSTTQVDASSYGPGNYYSSDTFIKYDGRRDTTDNGNLRGGETGVVTLDNAITNTGVLSVNGQTGDVTVDSGITKIFTLSSTSDLTNAQAAYDWYVNGGNPIIRVSPGLSNLYLGTITSTTVKFTRASSYGAETNGFWASVAGYVFTISSGSVTAVTSMDNYIKTSATAPASGTASNVITIVTD